MNLISSTIKNIAPIDRLWLEKAEARQLDLTKPPESLGELETIANRLCAIQETLKPSVAQKEIFVFAASHGVCDENVSPYPSTVTAQMVANFINGGAAINALAKVANANLTVVDVGVSGANFENVNKDGLRFINSKVCEGTKNFANEPAMTETEMHEALNIGIELATEAKRANVEIIGLGEMGIGNTTSASAITSALLEIEPETCTGRGTGANDAMLSHKIEVIKRALTTNQPQKDDAFDILQKVGGLEIAALVGLIIGAANNRIAIITDGFITTSAAALAVKTNANIKDYIFASHVSVECGHKFLLDFIKQKPLFDLKMRLGEGTGAALALNIIASSVAAFNEMATFSQAQVSDKS